MTAFTVEQKSQLAKLMANENITIQHQKIQTAKFDPKNRILYLPIWKDMSGCMYDLLGGHEVGHALYTPAEGWHDVAVDTTKGRNYKSFLNVVEDARIEKKVIRKYPGLKTSFRKAYTELNVRDFFGLAGREINGLAFIERLNIFTKSQYTQPISFSQEEMVLIGKIQMIETWEDTLRVTEEVYEYSKEEQFELQKELQNDFDSKMFEEDDDGDYEQDDDYSDDGDLDEDTESSSDSDGDSDDSDDDSDDSSDSNNSKKINRNKQSAESESSAEDFDPVCETDDNFRNNETILLDNKCKEYIYLEVPKVNTYNSITPANRVQELISNHYMEDIKEGRLTYAKINEYVKDFRNKNERYISLLAKEFEMRKAAKAFSKSKLSDTGDIDVNKLSSYQFDDNIFRKVMLVPKGKSHGLILLLDCSGSMSDNMVGSIEQILILSLFCRKVNIPFHVYGFTDDSNTWYMDRNMVYDTTHLLNENLVRNAFVKSNNSLNLSNVQLREYLNHKMSNSEFTKALRNMILLKMSYMGNRHSRLVSRPRSESLSNTPLTQAIVVCRDIMLNFKKINNLDLTNLVIVHDGDADSNNSYLDSEGKYNSYWPSHVNVILRDKKFQYEEQMIESKTSCSTFEIVLSWFNKTTHSKVFGFYIIEGRAKHAIERMYVNENGLTIREVQNTDRIAGYDLGKKIQSKFRSEKFIVSHKKNYTSFFMIAGGDNLVVDKEEIEIEGKVTASKLKNAFMKFNRGKQVNRVLVSKFIQGIAV